MLMMNKIAGTRNSCYLRPKESWLLEVRMADHYAKFNVGIMCLIPSRHRAGLVRKLFHHSETLFLICGSL